MAKLLFDTTLKKVSSGLIVSLVSISSWAYDVNIYQASEPNKSVIEVVDDCGNSHKLVIDNKNINSYKVLDWLDLLFVSGKYCQKNND